MENVKEIYQALLDGKTVRHTVSMVRIKLDEDGNYVSIANDGYTLNNYAPHFICPAKWEVVPEWYDNLHITGPVLCSVDVASGKATRLITRRLGNGDFVSDGNIVSTNATPLSTGAVEKLLEVARLCQS